MVKGVNFRDHQIVGDIMSLALRYIAEGADELVYYEITASCEQRSVDCHWISQLAEYLTIPFCVAGGIRDLPLPEAILAAGADKISINSPALAQPNSLVNSQIDLVANVWWSALIVVLNKKIILSINILGI